MNTGLEVQRLCFRFPLPSVCYLGKVNLCDFSAFIIKMRGNLFINLNPCWSLKSRKWNTKTGRVRNTRILSQGLKNSKCRQCLHQAVISTSHKAKGNINTDQFLYEDIKQTEEILLNQSSKNYLLSKNEPTNFLFASSFSSQTWLICPHENKIHHNVHSTNMKRFPSYTFPSSHKIKHQNIKISGRFPAVFLKMLCMLARVLLLSRPTFLREQEEDEA